MASVGRGKNFKVEVDKKSLNDLMGVLNKMPQHLSKEVLNIMIATGNEMAYETDRAVPQDTNTLASSYHVESGTTGMYAKKPARKSSKAYIGNSVMFDEKPPRNEVWVGSTVKYAYWIEEGKTKDGSRSHSNKRGGYHALVNAYNNGIRRLMRRLKTISPK